MPRMFLDDVGLRRLRAAIKNEPLVRDLASALADHAQSQVQLILEHRDLPHALRQWNRDRMQPISGAIRRLHDIALHAVIRDDAQALQAVIKVLDALPEADKGGPQEGRFRMGHSISVRLPGAFDLVADQMSHAQREQTANWLAERCVKANLALVADQFFDYAGANIPMRGVLTACSALASVWHLPLGARLKSEGERLEQLLDASVMGALGPEGYPTEDIGYGTYVGARLVWISDVAQRVMGWRVFERCPRLLKLGRAIAAFTYQGGHLLFNTGDHAAVFYDREAALLPLYARTQDPLLLWLLRNLGAQAEGADLSQRIAAVPPELTVGTLQSLPVTAMTLSCWADAIKQPPRDEQLPEELKVFRDRARDIVSMREGWHEHAAALVVDGSKRPSTAQGHAQASGGHFSFCAAGEAFAIDMGRYGINQQDNNVVLVDGKSMFSTAGQWEFCRRQGQLVDVRSTPWAAVTEVDAATFYGGRWAKRWVALLHGVSGLGWAAVIDDLNHDDAEHEYHWTLNTSPGNQVQLINPSSAQIFGGRAGHTLAVKFITPWGTQEAVNADKDQATMDIAGYLPELAQRIEAETQPPLTIHFSAFRRPRLLAKIKTVRLRLMTLLIPQFHEQPQAQVELVPSVYGSIVVKVTQSGITDTLAWAFDSGMIQTRDLSARGHWLIMRENSSSPKPTYFGPIESLRLRGQSYPCL